MNEIAGKVIAATVVLVAIYLFFFNAENSSKVLKSLSSGYVDIVTALQGRPGRNYLA